MREFKAILMAIIFLSLCLGTAFPDVPLDDYGAAWIDEDFGGSFPPEGWELIGDLAAQGWSNENEIVFAGGECEGKTLSVSKDDKFAFFETDSPDEFEVALISPSFRSASALPKSGGTNFEVSFAYVDENNAGNFDIKGCSDCEKLSDATWETLWPIKDLDAPVSCSLDRHYSIDLSEAMTGETFRIGFFIKSQGYASLVIDDLYGYPYSSRYIDSGRGGDTPWFICGATGQRGGIDLALVMLLIGVLALVLGSRRRAAPKGKK
jgi:hypothetical protein